MISIPKIPGYYTEPLDYGMGVTYDGWLNDNFFPANFDYEDLGLCSGGVNHIYGVKLGDFTKPTIVIICTMHGGEWEPAHYIIEMLKMIRDKTHPIWKVFDHFSIYCIPCANPWGYHRLTRRNANDVDINRNFDYYWESAADSEGTAPNSEVETQIIRDVIIDHKPICVIDNHTRGGAPSTGSDVGGIGAARNAAGPVEWINSLRLATGQSHIIFQGLAESPRLRSYASTFTSSVGLPTLGIVMEPAGGQDFEYQSTEAFTSYFIIAVYLKEWMKTGYQNLPRLPRYIDTNW